MLIDKTNMSHEEWLEKRRTFIGGSDAAGVVGMSPWVTPYQLWENKRGKTTVESNFPMRLGSFTESFIREEYAKETGLQVVADPYMHVSDEHPFMGCNLDGLVVIGDRQEGLEIKHTGSGGGWGSPGTDEVPDMYNLQVQHCMAVTGLERFRVAVVVGNRAPMEYIVNRNDLTIKLLIDKEGAFWEMVRNDTPPEPVNSEDVARRYRVDDGSTLEASQALADIVAKLRAVSEDRKKLEEVEENYKEMLKMNLRDHATLAYDGSVLATWKSNLSTVLDIKRLKAERPDVYQQFSSSKPTRRFLLK